MNYLFQKLGLAGTSAVVITESVNLDVLWNALITLAVSIVSVLSVEGVMWLKNRLTRNLKKDKED